MFEKISQFMIVQAAHKIFGDTNETKKRLYNLSVGPEVYKGSKSSPFLYGPDLHLGLDFLLLSNFFKLPFRLCLQFTPYFLFLQGLPSPCICYRLRWRFELQMSGILSGILWCGWI